MFIDESIYNGFVAVPDGWSLPEGQRNNAAREGRRVAEVLGDALLYSEEKVVELRSLEKRKSHGGVWHAMPSKRQAFMAKVITANLELAGFDVRWGFLYSYHKSKEYVLVGVLNTPYGVITTKKIILGRDGEKTSVPSVVLTDGRVI